MYHNSYTGLFQLHLVLLTGMLWFSNLPTQKCSCIVDELNIFDWFQIQNLYSFATKPYSLIIALAEFNLVLQF